MRLFEDKINNAEGFMKNWMAAALFMTQICAFAEHWYQEKLHNGWSQSYEIIKVLYEEKNDCEEIVFFENPLFGRVLAIDGIIQTTEKDEYIYGEMMTHVPILAHGNVKNVLIIGGGDGNTLKQVLYHPDVESVTLVEIDPRVIVFSRKYMPYVSDGAYEDPRLSVLIEDGSTFVQRTEERYDLIIVDSGDPVGPGVVLFTEEFYKSCKRCLKEDGIFVNHHSVAYLQNEGVQSAYPKLKSTFHHVSFFVAPVPSYVGGFFAFAFSSDKDYSHVRLNEIKERLASIKKPLRYYNPRIHKAAFALPQDLIEIIYGQTEE